MAWGEAAWWTLIRYGFKGLNKEYRADQGATLTQIGGDPICGNVLTPLATFGDYDTYLMLYGDFRLCQFAVTEVPLRSGGTFNCDELWMHKDANSRIGRLDFYYQGNVVYSQPIDSNFQLEYILDPQHQQRVTQTDVYVNYVCYVDLSGVIHAGISLTGVISEQAKNDNQAARAYEYHYSPTTSETIEDFLDAQLRGVYWDPEGNAGTPEDRGGGQGDYLRPDFEIGIPSLPSLSVCDTGFIKLYEISVAELNDLAADLWSDNFFESIIKNFRSPLDNIISLAMIPFTGLTGTLSQVEVGNYQSSAAGNRLSTSFYEVDCGIIDINEYYGTFADYTDTKIQLYLPLCTTITIDPDDCMNGKIRVVYHFDIFSGSCVAFVQTVTKGAWHVLYQVEGNIKSELPINGQNYLSVYTNLARAGLGMASNIATAGMAGKVKSVKAKAGMLGNAASGAADNAINAIENVKPTYQRSGGVSGTAGMLGVMYPYIIFSTPSYFVPDNFKSLKGYVSNLKIKISDATGYIKCRTDNVDMTGFSTATNDEIEMIKSLLNEGIYME